MKNKFNLRNIFYLGLFQCCFIAGLPANAANACPALGGDYDCSLDLKELQISQKSNSTIESIILSDSQFVIDGNWQNIEDQSYQGAYNAECFAQKINIAHIGSFKFNDRWHKIPKGRNVIQSVWFDGYANQLFFRMSGHVQNSNGGIEPFFSSG